jgi:formate dehydrogenase subunit delta
MNIEHLVKMANQIGAFFEAESQREDAVNGVLGHLRRFWEPRMRREIISHVHNSGGNDLKDIVREAVKRLSIA